MSNTIKVIKPQGILDGINGHQLRRDINDIIERDGMNVILINLENITFMDSSGLSSLVSLQRAARSAKTKLCLCSINDQVRIVFELTRMDRVFDIFLNEQEVNKNLFNKD